MDSRFSLFKGHYRFNFLIPITIVSSGVCLCTPAICGNNGDVDDIDDDD